MNNIFRKIFRMRYRTGKEYMFSIDEIIITPQFKAARPRHEKWIAKNKYFKEHGKFETPVTLTRDFVLIDGYCTYLICKKNGTKCPCIFIS